MADDLERLYQEAKSALASKDYERASSLLRQILVIDENYKDASRLLAQTVKLRRRRWYNHPLLWGSMGLLAVVAVGLFIAPGLRVFSTTSPTDAIATSSPTVSFTPTITLPPTETPLPAPTAVPLTWKRVSLGQEFERDTVSALVIDPKDPDVLYAGMENAGIFKSIDGGLSWRPAHQGLANAHITSLWIDFQNPQTLYAGTMDGILKTEDGAENWYKTGEGNYLLMDPQNSSHAYARDGDNIYESTDQGKTWKVVYSSEDGCPGKIYSWAIHPADGKTLFIVGGEDCEPGIYQSKDSGYTWTIKKPIYMSDNIGIRWIDSLIIGLDRQGGDYIVTGEGLVHNEFGAWRTLLDFGPPVTFDSTGLVYFFCDPHLCKFELDTKQREVLGKPDIGNFTVITISPHDPNTIYIAGEGISASIDGGLTWTKLNNGLGSGTLQLDTNSGDSNALYLQSGRCGNVTGVSHKNVFYQFKDDAGQPLYLSADGGRSWDLSIKTGCYLIKDVDPQVLYRVGQDWTYTENFALIYWLWQSEDKGSSWQTVITSRMNIKTVVADMIQSGLLYGYGLVDVIETGKTGYMEDGLFYSEDFGHSWQRRQSLVNKKLCHGSTLQFIDAYRPMAIDPSDGNHVLVIDNGVLLESHNSCETTNAFAMAPTTSMNSIAFDPQQLGTLYAGTDEGAYVSFDSGETWNQINDGLLGATVVYSIVVDKDSNVYAATPYGIFKLEAK